MRKIALLTLIFFSFTAFVSPQTEPKTVTDFYYLLSKEYFVPYSDDGDTTRDVRAFRKSLIKIEDVKNGYLRLEGMSEGWSEVAIFKKTNGKYIVGISQTGCGPSCSSETNFLSYENGRWQDITTQVLPEISDAELSAAYKRGKVRQENQSGLLVYELPRTGTIIKVKTGDDDVAEVVLFELSWNGAKFILKNK